jgi:Fe-S cluster assembly protein SufD
MALHEQYVTRFEALSGNGAAGDPGWLGDLRRDGIARFAEVGFPHSRLEEWRFTNVAPIAQTEFAPAPASSGTTVADLAADIVIGGTDRVVVTGLAQAIGTHEDLVRAHLGRHARVDANPFTALNTAFIQDGAFVYVPRGAVVDRPIQLVFLTTAEDQPVLAHVRNLIVVERGAQASLIETYAGPPGAVYWTSAVTEMVIGENANVDTYRVQRESEQAFHTATSQSYQQRDSVFSHIPLVFGSALSRHDVNAVLDGQGAECTLNGLSVLHGRQHVDHHTTLEHAQPHCNSWEFFNGVYDERSRGVFNGRIIVRRPAQRTDSKQTNNNLLLSPDARADSQPQLEIYADDVRCTHGATLGPIEPKTMFYLQSRGLSPDEARQLLTYGFASEILGYVTLDALRERLDQLVRRRLDEAARERSAV